MSMSISATDYWNSVLQNTRTVTSEKKNGAPEVGKTQQSAVSASLDQVNMGEDGIAVTEVSRQQGVEQSVPQNSLSFLAWIR